MKHTIQQRVDIYKNRKEKKITQEYIKLKIKSVSVFKVVDIRN